VNIQFKESNRFRPTILGDRHVLEQPFEMIDLATCLLGRLTWLASTARADDSVLGEHVGAEIGVIVVNRREIFLSRRI